MLNLLAAGGTGRISRRQLLGLGSQGALGLALQPLLLAEAAQAAAPARSSAKARQCIYIFLCGGPSQLDLWDPKPDALDTIRGPFKSIDTSVPGIRFTELIPRVASHADKLAVIRSMHHGSADHNFGIAHTLLGQLPASANDLFVTRRDHPALGAILHKLRGDCGVLPPWVTLPRPFTTLSPPHKGQSAGFLGASYDSVTLNEPKIDSLAPKELRLEALDRPADVSADRFDARRRLLTQSNVSPGAGSDAQARWEGEVSRAMEMLSGPACRRAFDLSSEPDSVRDRYGRNEYGQSFLLARRLVEAGVRMVNVFWTYFDKKGCQFNLWDNHGVTTDICGVGGILTGEQMLTHDYCTPSFDRAFSALLEDLEARGLLDETLVAVAGEFGRTPKINTMAGRDHWPFCYSQLLAGGGVRGGQVYGTSDKTAAYVKENPVTPDDFAATILHAFGVDPGAMIEDRFSRPFRLSEGTPLASLFG
ncbi:DUF1501 domain-containing protein [Singulisphaera sp. Ch08]|uniref:DUF1501 domain-containing protein n=1 Tax=Singulisphaera sp. Ch08 TaxID=3120278 RepID=A0AAU7CHX2_9BACT